jgi:hypothetical protein
LFNDDAINRLYNTADFGINTSDGEGFGLCQLEHAQTGAPQIVTDVGSYEFLNGSAVIIPASQRLYHSQTMPLGLFGQVATADDVTAGMELAIKNGAHLRTILSQTAFPAWSDVCAEFLEDMLSMNMAIV